MVTQTIIDIIYSVWHETRFSRVSRLMFLQILFSIAFPFQQYSEADSFPTSFSSPEYCIDNMCSSRLRFRELGGYFP